MAKEFGLSKEKIHEINLVYKTALPFLENAKKAYQISWNEINDEFSKYIEKETGYKWFYPEYECVVSSIHEEYRIGVLVLKLREFGVKIHIPCEELRLTN